MGFFRYNENGFYNGISRVTIIFNFLLPKTLKNSKGAVIVQDIYFEMAYGKLYEAIESGACDVFEFENELGKVRHLFLKRQISVPIDGVYYYDLTTPYGYGGPLMIGTSKEHKKELAEQFKEAFQNYCEQNHVVSEFIRFHPLFLNGQDFKGVYDVQHRRHTVGTNLQSYEDPIQAEFTKSTKKNIRNALKSGVTFNVIVNPEDLKSFKDIYYATMKRNKADSIYYFDDQYFSDCLTLLGKNVILVEVCYEGKIIGMGLNFIYDKLIHCHLSGTLEEYHQLSPAYVLQYALALWGKENGYHLIHDGGGRTSDPKDTLFQFKKQFGKNTGFDYFVGHKIWNKEIYRELCSAMGVHEETDYFPAYRKMQSKE